MESNLASKPEIVCRKLAHLRNVAHNQDYMSAMTLESRHQLFKLISSTPSSGTFVHERLAGRQELSDFFRIAADETNITALREKIITLQ